MTIFMNPLKILNKYHRTMLVKTKLFKVLNIVSKSLICIDFLLWGGIQSKRR